MKSTDPVNLLFVFSDQHRWCDLGCYGNAQVASPRLDAFAAEGLLCTNAFTNSPLCVPTRGTLLTGLHSLRHGAVSNDLPIRPSLDSFGAALKRQGYRTGYIGKWHLAGVPREQAVTAERRMGFDTWKVRQCSHAYMDPQFHDEENVLHKMEGYEPTIQTDLALEFLEAGGNGAAAPPWALVLSWGPPHDPYHKVPNNYLESFEPAHLQLRANVPTNFSQSDQGTPISRSVIQEWLAGYCAHIKALDDQFGRLVDALKASGQWERTLVVFTSDHGDMLGSQGLYRKQWPYEESVHVPLMFGGGWAGLRRGICEDMLGLADLAPTLLGALGGHFEHEPDGRDLSSLLLEGASPSPHEDEVYLYSIMPCHDAEDRGDYAWRAVRTRTHLFAINADSNEDWLLFDMVADPLQQHNLVGNPQSAPLAADLRARLEAYAEQHDGLVPGPELLRHHGLVDLWNTSQREFGRVGVAVEN